jgi:hypothetical protein
MNALPFSEANSTNKLVASLACLPELAKIKGAKNCAMFFLSYQKLNLLSLWFGTLANIIIFF